MFIIEKCITCLGSNSRCFDNMTIKNSRHDFDLEISF